MEGLDWGSVKGMMRFAVPGASRAPLVGLSLSLLAAGGSLQAAGTPETATTYRDAVAAALASNPEVVSAYYDVEAALESQRSAAGDFYPSVDVNAEVGWEERTTPLNDFGDYDRDSVRFSITQLLFDGFQTRDQVRALGQEKLARYHDFNTAAQDIALAATVAYADTVLFQRLVAFAEENYVEHRKLFNKIEQRVKAGRDEAVNLEQAKARLALAESNLLTEVTNLHDTRAEFQRVVGLLPAPKLPMPTVPGEMLPNMREQALSRAYAESPQISSAIAEMRAAEESLNASRGPLYPRIDLRYRNEIETNINGFLGDYDLQAVELVISYNLFRGGGDVARRREYSAKYYAAIENRKDACLDVRREVTITFNDIRALEQQVAYLELQLDSQNSARLAYQDQFNRNQRSLLDLLDSQNEYFDTQRSLAKSRTDLIAAQAKLLAELGVLTSALSVQGFNADRLLDVASEDARQAETDAFCSEVMVRAIDIDQEDIIRRLDQRASDDPISLIELPVPGSRLSRNPILMPAILTPVPPETVAMGTSQPPLPSSYLIEEGDTLYSLSSKFDVPMQELVQLNNLQSASLIYEGRELLLP